MRDDWKKFEGQVFNNIFPLQKLLGSTSYSAVFLSKSAHAQSKNIAIKFISSGAKTDSRTSLLHRASRLSHPNVLRVLPGVRCRLGDLDLVFVVMEYAEEDLGRILRDRPLTAEEAREMLGTLLDALYHIHSKGFAHSHIKPSNIMTIGNQLKLANDTVLPLGEPRPAHHPTDTYDAPEAASALVAASSDVWSLGVTLVEMLTQRSRFIAGESRRSDRSIDYSSALPRHCAAMFAPRSSAPLHDSSTRGLSQTRSRPGCRKCCDCGSRTEN